MCVWALYNAYYVIFISPNRNIKSRQTGVGNIKWQENRNAGEIMKYACNFYYTFRRGDIQEMFSIRRPLNI